MADTQSRTPGVIRSTREYLNGARSPAAASPAGSEDARAPSPLSTLSGDDDSPSTSNCRDNPREIRNKAEKQRRDKLNHSISELAGMVPPVVASNRKIDKTGVLRLTAHYLRAHQYVFGDSIGKTSRDFKPAAAQALLSLLNGFLVTTTYKGLIVVISQNVQQYLGYAELDLLGQNVFNIIHQDDHQTLRENLMPKSHLLGPNGELLLPDEPEGRKKVADELASERRRFIVRFKKHCQRSEPVQYVSCFVEGTLRKSDRACRGYNRCCQVVRRARARADNPCSSGNDVVFIGVVRPNTETFISERNIEAFRMEYRTRHSIGGEIMECEQRISLVTGYMTHEVQGTNAMNFMHKDDMRWVVFALREVYQQQTLVGESCYRLMAKNGQFIYLRTVGRLDVDQDSRAVRTFVCINTVVEEQEGKRLIKAMKRKYMMNINNNALLQEAEEAKDVPEDQTLPVEDPKNLEKVILYLVTGLPAVKCDTQSDDSGGVPERVDSPSLPLAIIPPKKERIISSIEKIYTVIKAFQREPEMENRFSAGPKKEKDKKKERVNSLPSFSSKTMTGSEPCGFLLKRRQVDALIENRMARNVHDDSILMYGHPKQTLPPVTQDPNEDTIYIPLRPERVDDPNQPKQIWPIVEQRFDTADIRRLELSLGSHCIQPTILEGNESRVNTPSPGTKRAFDSSDFTSSIKRTPTEGEEKSHQPCSNVSLDIIDEKLLNESLLNSAMDTIENDIDPTFPDLLAQEVGDFLDQIESQPIIDEKTVSDDSLL